MSPTEFTVQNGSETVRAMVQWETTDQRVRSAWANDIDATEAGAYACALAAAELTGTSGYPSGRNRDRGRLLHRPS
jgi:hypothetical protein